MSWSISHSRLGRLLAALTFAATCLSGVSLITLAAPKPSAGQKAAAASAAAKEGDEAAEKDSERGIRLYYFQAHWRIVLSDIAKATKTKVVAEKYPFRLYTRFDRRKYTPSEAMKILNQELEPQGFRILIRDGHLLLLDVVAMRQDYARPVTPNAEKPQAGERPNHSPAAVVAWSEDHAAGVQTAAARDGRAVSRSNAVRQVAHEEPAAPVVKRVEIPLENQKAARIGKIVHGAFGRRGEVVARTKSGLPGFRVFRDDSLSSIWFTVGIDEEQNALLLESTEADGNAVLQLIQALDIPPQGQGKTQKAISTQKGAAEVARSLQPQIKQLVRETRKAERNAEAAEGDDEAMDGPPAAPAGPRTRTLMPRNEDRAKPAAPGERPSRDDLPGLLEGLRSEVTVESVPDLGVLILRGNQKDVDAVMEVVRQIEQLSTGAAPEVRLLLLEHVSSEGLAELMGTLYDRLRNVRGSTVQQSQTVTFIPISRPNAILILASGADMESVEKLAAELDQPVDPQSQFQVIKLKYAIPSHVVEAVTELYPAATSTQNTQQQNSANGGLIPRVRITADVRTNSVIVQGRPRDLKELAAVIEKLDVNESGSVNELRIIPLKSATAEDVAYTLSTAIQSVTNPARAPVNPAGGTGGQGQFGGGQNQGGTGTGGSAELRDVKATMLQFLSIDGEGQKLLSSGLLSDVRITADPRTNSIVVTSPKEGMTLIVELVKQLDQPAAQVAEIKVFSLTKGDAAQMVTLLQGLFSTQQGQNNQNRAAGNVPGVLLTGADDASSSLVPLRFSVDSRTNSIIAVGGADALRVVEAVLIRLDGSDIRQRESRVFRLKNSYAVAVANAVNQFLTSRRQVDTNEPGLVSPFEQIEREVVVVPEEATNSLLISATPRYFSEIRDLVTNLDAAPQQVTIQALLVEVTLDNQDEFGMELGLQDSVLFDRSLLSNVVTVPTTNTAPNGVATTTNTVISKQATPGFAFNNQPFGNNPINQGVVGKQALTNFAVGRVNGDLGYGGLVLSAGSESVSFLLRALAARRRVDILSRPMIRTLDNQLAQIQVGQQVPIVNGVNVTAVGTANPQVQQQQVGIILTVTPRITPDKTVVMEVAAEKSSLTSAGVPIYTDAANGNTVESPIIDITTARTTVSIRDNQTIVLGGMITKFKEKVERKVPFVGDIPILGAAFRYDYKAERRTELLIFLTPRVVGSDSDSEFVKQVETERIHFIESDAEQIHGPILAVPPPDSVFGPDCPPDMLPDGTFIDGGRIPTSVMRKQQFDQTKIPGVDYAPTQAVPNPGFGTDPGYQLAPNPNSVPGYPGGAMQENGPPGSNLQGPIQQGPIQQGPLPPGSIPRGAVPPGQFAPPGGFPGDAPGNVPPQPYLPMSGSGEGEEVSVPGPLPTSQSNGRVRGLPQETDEPAALPRLEAPQQTSRFKRLGSPSNGNSRVAASGREPQSQGRSKLSAADEDAMSPNGIQLIGGTANDAASSRGRGVQTAAGQQTESVPARKGTASSGWKPTQKKLPSSQYPLRPTENRDVRSAR